MKKTTLFNTKKERFEYLEKMIKDLGYSYDLKIGEIFNKNKKIIGYIDTFKVVSFKDVRRPPREVKQNNGYTLQYYTVKYTVAEAIAYLGGHIPAEEYDMCKIEFIDSDIYNTSLKNLRLRKVIKKQEIIKKAKENYNNKKINQV